MNRQQNSSFAYPSFVTLCLVLGNSRPDQCTCNSSNGSYGARSCKGGHDGTGCDERSDARNGQRTNPGQPPKHSTNNSTCCGSCCCPFGCLGVLFVCEILCPFVVREEHGNVTA